MFGIGTFELVMISGVSVMLFGGRLPKVARSVGQSLMEFKRGFLEVSKECERLESEVSA